MSSWTQITVIGATISIGSLLLLTLVIVPPGSSYNKGRELCNQAVENLLKSKDLVEVTRAGIIINRLECSIGKRLP